MTRRVSVFGATGSVGESTLSLLEGRADIEVVALTGGRNVARLAEQARAHRAALAVTAHDECYVALKQALSGSGIEVAAGTQAITEAAARPADWSMSAIVGAAGLAPGFAALAHGGVLALANKESLVCAGALLLDQARRHSATILPVDSEHSADFQALAGERMEAVETVTITSSGGAFRDWPIERLASASVAEASTHPNFAMGQRITIDSATMFNKAMEVIEAREFFGLRPDQIEVILQREQIIHALVAFTDGGVMAHLGAPDMRHPIGYALNWPHRGPVPVARLDLAALGRLTFEAPDPRRYPALALAQAVMQAGGAAGAVFNAAKEIALDHFIAGGIGFLDMAAVVEDTLSRFDAAAGLSKPPSDLSEVMAVDQLARRLATDAAQARAAHRHA